MNWYSIIVTILMVIGGFLAEYFKTKQKIWDKVNAYIDKAEEAYKDVAKSGSSKRQFVLEALWEIVPAPMKIFITKDMIEAIIQKAFDAIASYASKQLDKVVDKIAE